MRDRYGEAALAAHFRAFDTICSATQERQDAVDALLDTSAARPDDRRRRLQQQQHLQPGAHLRRARADVSHRGSGLPDVGRAHPAPAGGCAVDGQRGGSRDRELAAGDGRIVVGLTAGASTPNNIVGAGDPAAGKIRRERVTAGARRRGSPFDGREFRATGVGQRYPDGVPAFSGQEAIEVLFRASPSRSHCPRARVPLLPTRGRPRIPGP